MDRFQPWQQLEAEHSAETCPGCVAPFMVRRSNRVELERQAQHGLFGIIRHWSEDLAIGRKKLRSSIVHLM